MSKENFRMPVLPNLEITELLGKGGMASVWRAHDTMMDREVAVKILDEIPTQSSDDVKQFIEEARAMTNISHQGIVHAFDMRCHNKMYYIIMELVDGYTFAARIQNKGHIEQDEAMIIAESVASALNYVWEKYQIIHCDIKPENLMVHSDGIVKVTDLGLCRHIMKSGNDEAIGNEVIGTPGYLSPEQVYGDSDIDCRSDIYSLGATLYHLVTGRLLFEGMNNDDMLRAHVQDNQAPDPRTFNSALTYPFAQLIMKMLIKDRDLRYKNWKEVLKAIALVNNGKCLSPANPAAISSVQCIPPETQPKTPHTLQIKKPQKMARVLTASGNIKVIIKN